MKKLTLALVLVAACTQANRTSAPTTTSAPVQGPTQPASPPDSWTSSGGPASPGSPGMGTVVDPTIQPVHDGGVW